MNLLQLHNHADNIITAALLMLEGYYLRKHGSSFAESFYDLQRAKNFGEEGTVLTLKEQMSSLFYVVRTAFTASDKLALMIADSTGDATSYQTETRYSLQWGGGSQ